MQRSVLALIMVLFCALSAGSLFAQDTPQGRAVDANILKRWNGQEVPDWLIEVSRTRQAKLRKVEMALLKEMSVDSRGMPMDEIVDLVAKKTGVAFWINTTELDLLALAPDQPITLRLPETTVEEILRVMLSPLELTYVVRDFGVEITSQDSADDDLAVRCYDLAWLVSEDWEMDEVREAIMKAIDAHSWLEAGGVATLTKTKSVLVVAAPYSTQRKIVRFLGQLALLHVKRDAKEGELK